MAGSLNLLCPSDKTPENDAIDLRNWRVDQAGVLRGADAFSRLTHINTTYIHTIKRIDDFTTTQAYVNGVETIAFGQGIAGPGANLKGGFFIGAGTSLFFYWPGGAAGTGSLTTLATGLSGQPLSIEVWNGFIWVLDSLQQLKIDPAILTGIFPGTAVTVWLPPVPPTPAAAAANTSGNGPLVGMYNYYVTYVNYVFPAIGGYLQARESAGGAGVSVTAVNGTVSITGLPYQSGIGAIRLYRNGGAGPLAATYFVAQFGNGLDPTGKYCNVSLTATYPSNDQPFFDVLSDAQITATGVTMPTVGAAGAPATPITRAAVSSGFTAAATGPVGTYRYYLTGVNSAGLETNPGPVSNNVTPTNGLIDLTLALSAAGDTIRWRLYRVGGSLGNAYRVTEFTSASQTTYTDGAPDLALTELGIQMPTTNDPPPAGIATDSMGFVGPYFNRLLAWKNGKLYWSQDGVPLFPGSQDGSATGNWVNVGNADDKIQAITLHARIAGIYKQRTIWRLGGDVVTGTLEQTAATCGAVGKMAVANCGAYDAFLSNDGPYLFTLDQVSPIGDKIAPVFLGKQWIGLGFSDTTPFRGQDIWGTPQHPVCCFFNGTLLISNGGSYVGDAVGAAFVYHPETQRWAAFTQNTGSAITAACAFGSQYTFFIGDFFGYLSISQQVARFGQQFTWQTQFLDQGLGDQPKLYQEVVIDAELNGASMTAYVLFNDASSAPALSSVAAPYRQVFGGIARQKFYLPLPQDEGDNGQPHISVRLEIGAVVDGQVPPAIHGMYIYYAVEERDASMRGTQVLDFRSERVQLAQRLEVDAVGPVMLTVNTDQPGGLAARYTFTTTQVGRGIVEFKLPPNVRGQLWRVDVAPQNSTARVYSVRAWMREVGTAQTETWQWKDFLRSPDAEVPDVE